MQHLIGNYRHKKGLTAIEYSLIAVLFILAAVGATASIGKMISTFQGLSSNVTVVSG